MPQILNIPTYHDERGSLSVIEKLIPFDIKRLYYIYGASGDRAGHRHRTISQGMICLNGSCDVLVHDGTKEQVFKMDSPEKCLLLDPKDWHKMYNFSKDCILLVLASGYYDKEGYINEKYE